MATFRTGISLGYVNDALAEDYCGHFKGAPPAASIVGANSSCCWVWGKEREGYVDDESFVVYLDAAGKYWAAWESSDSTGHGCRCSGGYNGPHDTLEDCLRLGLGDDQRDGWRQAGLTGESTPAIDGRVGEFV